MGKEEEKGLHGTDGLWGETFDLYNCNPYLLVKTLKIVTNVISSHPRAYVRYITCIENLKALSGEEGVE